MLPGCLSKACNIGIDFVIHINLFSKPLQPDNVLSGGNLLYLVNGVIAVPCLENIHLALQIRIAHIQLNHKPVQLRFGKHLGTHGTNGILGSNDNKGSGQYPGNPINGYAALLHNLQKGRLGLAGGPVDFVRQKQIAHDNAGLIIKAAGLFIVNGKARYIRRHNVRGKLHPVMNQMHRLGDGQRHGGLAHAGNVLNQNMSTRQHRQQYLDYGFILADNGFFYLPDNLLCLCDGRLNLIFHTFIVPFFFLCNLEPSRSHSAFFYYNTKPAVLQYLGQESPNFFCSLSQQNSTHSRGKIGICTKKAAVQLTNRK